MTEEPPEWCIIATLLPYPYRPGPSEGFRSHGIYPAGAKLHVIGGFAGMGHVQVTVVGVGHHGHRLVTAHLEARYLGGWRVALVYRPAVLRAIRKAVAFDQTVAHRWNRQGLALGSAEYAEHLRSIAEGFQERDA